jgi:hypothetical protein
MEIDAAQPSSLVESREERTATGGLDDKRQDEPEALAEFREGLGIRSLHIAPIEHDGPDVVLPETEDCCSGIAGGPVGGEDPDFVGIHPGPQRVEPCQRLPRMWLV